MSEHTDKQTGPWLALFHVPQLSLKRKHALLSYFGSAEKILAASAAQWTDAGITAPVQKAFSEYGLHAGASELGQQVSRSLQWAQKPDCTILSLNHHCYPDRLRQIAVPPLLLFVRGSPALLQAAQIAIVGSRNASATGLESARVFARQLGMRGLVVTSGLALGIDGASHLGALEVSQPTVAVMATGADRIYPRRHKELAQKITHQGALVTEFSLGSQPRPAHFPQRNRIISGLCLGVLVVEAAVKSGSLITARFAMEQGREVFAIPGSIHNPLSKGCHELIRQGVKLVESIDDILEEIAPQLVAPVSTLGLSETEPATLPLDGETKQVLAQVGYEVTPMDLLVERTQLPVSKLIQVLMRLELDRFVQPVSGGYIRVA